LFYMEGFVRRTRGKACRSTLLKTASKTNT
jgi:hypothetical protein